MRSFIALIVVTAGLYGISGCSPDSPPSSRPNILYIVADDLGFTDIGAFGSEIPTPNIDQLAYEGVRLTNFHAAASCQPTRVMMMASASVAAALEIHGSSVTGMRGNLLSRDWAILPELLQDAGYATYMSGKWDLGVGDGYTPATRGFDRSFVLLDASASHFAEKFWESPVPYEDEGRPLRVDDLPEDFYATEYYTDKILEFLESHDGEKPWFAYVPYTTPHWPLQLPDSWLDRHVGRYDSGYDVLRNERVRRAKEVGVFPQDASLGDFVTEAPPWLSLNPEERRRQARAQEIYAGMVEHLDYSVGRLVQYLEDSGQLENTVIVFSSDHGASSSDEGLVEGRVGRRVFDRDNSLENFGRRGSFIDHGLGFGEAATAPFKGYKGTLYEGGLRAAAFVRYPREVPAGRVGGAFMTMMDILPTFLEIAGTAHPGKSTYKGREINDIRGQSFWSYVTGKSDSVHSSAHTAGWSQGNGGALIRGNYKIVSDELTEDSNAIRWELYDLVEDPGETKDLAAQQPGIVDELREQWARDWR